MIILMSAFPQLATTMVAIDVDGTIAKEYKPFWLDDIIPMVHQAQEEYNIEKVIVCGPPAYAGHIAKKIEEHNQVKVELETSKELTEDEIID